MSLAVRRLREYDWPQWRALWTRYLEFYKTQLPDDVTQTSFRRLLEDKRFAAFAAQSGDAIIGICHCHFHPTSWSRRDYCYLEDLYVEKAARGAGAGRALIEAVYALADERGAARVYWSTQENNMPARRLYDKLATLSDFVQYRR